MIPGVQWTRELRDRRVRPRPTERTRSYAMCRSWLNRLTTCMHASRCCWRKPNRSLRLTTATRAFSMSSAVTSCGVPARQALRPSTSPGPATRRVRRFPDSEQMEILTLPSHSTKIPRGTSPSRNNVLPRGKKARAFRLSKAFRESSGRSQKSRSGRASQSRQLCCIAVSMLLS